ncbi:MAG: hypothetical protein IJ391_03325 [Clostridia bacterium]|nr:hypothetical protein [Clostridia bacterium]
MKHLSQSEWCNFNFHDAFAENIKWENGSIVMGSVFRLNISKDSVHNPFEYDMEIKEAKVSFNNVNVISFEYGGGIITDANGQKHEEPRCVITGAEASDLLMNELSGSLGIYFLDMEHDNGKQIYTLEAHNVIPFFSVVFSSDPIIVQWDDYSCEAWYERHPFRKD